MINNKSVVKIICDERACTGCAACMAVCPTHAINCVYNEEGFTVPKIDKEKCINCGNCQKVCTKNSDFKIKPLTCYAGVSNNFKIRNLSSSGGIFAEIAKVFLKNDGYVCGACMLTDYIVRHIIIKDIEHLYKLQGSKYVQSDICGIHEKLGRLLETNNKVLFCGTPCQTSSILSYLSFKEISIDNFYCIDLVCHGVPSPIFFKNHIYNNYGCVTEVKFRHRTKHELNCYAIGYRKEDKYIIKTPTNSDFYYSCFSSHVSLRESCYQCKFARPERVGDITLGDLGTHKRYEKYFGIDKSLSFVLVNTEKGREILSDCDISMHDADFLEEVKVNKRLREPTTRPMKRDNFYKELFKNGEFSEKRVYEYRYRPPMKERVKTTIIQSTTVKQRKNIKKIITNIKGTWRSRF